MEILTELMMKASSWLTLLPRISLRNLFEIAIISFLVYEILFWIKNTRAWTLLKGLLTIMVFAIVAVLLRLDTIVWILKNITTIAVTAFLVVFQPELRKALEQLGSRTCYPVFWLRMTERAVRNLMTAQSMNWYVLLLRWQR